MTFTLHRRLSARSLRVERLEDRVLMDVAPIGPILDPDNTEVWSHAYFNQINASLAAVDVPSQISVRTPGDARQRHGQLIEYLWKGAGFPAEEMPEAVAFDVAVPFGPQYPPLPNLQGVDRLTIAMDYGLTSRIYFFHADESSDRLLIWHQGHDDDLANTGGYDTIAQFLEQGYSVLASWMPLLGENVLEEPITIGDCEIFSGHDDFACAETEDFAPLKYFVEPVTVALNYALTQVPVDDVVMVGLSGGGWTTTLYAAVDPRVRVSIPVAGTLPLFLRVPPYDSDLGDWEQSGSSIYAVADYLDLYVLGSYGPGRKQVQVVNKYDDCCFAGVRYRTYLDYVKDTVAGLKAGAFTVFLDDSMLPAGAEPSHRVSQHALTTAIHHGIYQDHVQFVDDGENTYWNGSGTDRDTFHREGVWQPRKGPGFANDVLSARPGGGEARARWQFKVTPGRYLVAVTWNPDAARGVGVAPFTVFDGLDPLARIPVDQRYGPADFFDGQAFWHILGEFHIGQTQLVVQLANDSDGVILADGVRVEYLGQSFAGRRAAAVLHDGNAVLPTMAAALQGRLENGGLLTVECGLEGRSALHNLHSTIHLPACQSSAPARVHVRPTRRSDFWVGAPEAWTCSFSSDTIRSALVTGFPCTRHSA